jgi:transposase
MTDQSKPLERVIGLDAHPDSFTAALVQGPTPLAAIVEKMFNKVPLAQLQSWATKHTTAGDLIVLEASGNSFQVARTLLALGRRTLVLESCHLGKLKEAHANNDKISAVRIAKAYLAGTAKEVWIPDPKTQERRDWFHAHRKAVNQCVRARNSLLSYLSDNGVRLKKGTPLTQPSAVETLRQAHSWSARQWQLIEGLRMQLRHAQEQRVHWRSLLTQEVMADEQLLALMRLCGVRHLIAFAVGALVGDIKRFKDPKKLVKYIGLNPAFDDSGLSRWSGGIGGHGRKDLRSLLMQGAQAILRTGTTPLAKWGKKLLATKAHRNIAVAAIARRLTVAIWYLMMGRWTPLDEIDQRLQIKVSKMLGELTPHHLENSGKNRKQWKEDIGQKLKSTQVYRLDPRKVYPVSQPAGA